MKCPHCGASVNFLKAFFVTNRWKNYQCSECSGLSNWKVGNLIFLLFISLVVALIAKVVVAESGCSSIYLQGIFNLIVLLVLCYFFGKFERIRKHN